MEWSGRLDPGLKAGSRQVAMASLIIGIIGAYLGYGIELVSTHMGASNIYILTEAFLTNVSRPTNFSKPDMFPNRSRSRPTECLAALSY